MAILFDPVAKARLLVPDDYDETKSQAELQAFRNQQEQETGSNWLGLIGRAIQPNGGIGSFFRQTPRIRQATVDPRAAAVMTPQALQSYMAMKQDAINQQAQMEWRSQEQAQEREQQGAIQRERSKIQLKQMIDNEKYRADQLKLQKMNAQNAQTARDLAKQEREEERNYRREQDKLREEKGSVVSVPGQGPQNIYWDPEQQRHVRREIEGMPAPTSLARGGGGGGGGRKGGGGKGSGKEGGGVKKLGSYTVADRDTYGGKEIFDEQGNLLWSFNKDEYGAFVNQMTEEAQAAKEKAQKESSESSSSWFGGKPKGGQAMRDTQGKLQEQGMKEVHPNLFQSGKGNYYVVLGDGTLSPVDPKRAEQIIKGFK